MSKKKKKLRKAKLETVKSSPAKKSANLGTKELVTGFSPKDIVPFMKWMTTKMEWICQSSDEGEYLRLWKSQFGSISIIKRNNRLMSTRFMYTMYIIYCDRRDNPWMDDYFEAEKCS